MDVRKEGFHARVKISGIGDTKTLTGSPVAIMAATLELLRKTTPRKLADGAIQVNLSIRSDNNWPAEDAGEISRVESVLSSLAIEPVNPTESFPDYKSYYEHLVEVERYTESHAAAIARDWFPDG